MNNIVRNYKHGHIIIDLDDTFIGPSIYNYGEYCEEEVELFSKLIKPGDRVLDIGANIGAFTIPFSKMVGDTGKVIAFEPQVPIHNMLCGNVAINNLKNTFIFHSAVGDRYEKYYIPEIDYSKKQNYGGIELNKAEGNRINTVQIDTLFKNKVVNFMKIDVEGMELEVLRTAGWLIGTQKPRPIIYFENDREDKSEETLSFVRNSGYKLYEHISHLYREDNHFGKVDNIWDKDYICKNVLAIPDNMDIDLGLKEI